LFLAKIRIISPHKVTALTSNQPTDALLANDTDPNANDVISVIAVGDSALGASVILNNDQVQYDIGNRFQALGAGQMLTDTFAYTIRDRKGETDSSVVNVTITGINDASITIKQMVRKEANNDHSYLLLPRRYAA
jgi:VCBS repeat-containing protein